MYYYADWHNALRRNGTTILKSMCWCDRVNSTYKKHIRAVPRELFAL